MVISILGCGWYGKALAKWLIEKGFIVKGSATNGEKADQLSAIGIIPFVIQFSKEIQKFDPDFFRCDILIISIPPKTRQGEGNDYLSKIQKVIALIRQYQINKVIYISSSGVYSDKQGEVSELDDPRPDTEAGNLLVSAEKLFTVQSQFRTTIIRFAGLVGPGRHPGRFFAGKKDIPNGLALVNLIHQKDCVEISGTIIEQDTFGYLFNASSPDHPSKADFYTAASKQAGFDVPQFISELKSHKVLNSINLYSILNYKFKVPEWKSYVFEA